MTDCAIDGCEKTAWCRGWCQPHYNRWKAHGDPLAGSPLRPDRTPEERAERKRQQDRDWMRQKRAANPGWDAAEQRRRRAENPEPFRAYKRQWREEKGDRELAQERARYATDPEQHLRRKREWKAKNPDLWRTYMARGNAKRRAKGCIDAWTWAEVTARDNDICQDCGRPTVIGARGAEARTIDHIVPLSKAAPGTIYRLDDVQTLCRSCNSRKWAHDTESESGAVAS